MLLGVFIMYKKLYLLPRVLGAILTSRILGTNDKSRFAGGDSSDTCPEHSGFLKRFPGWVDEEHINLLLGIYLLGINVLKHNYNNINTQETLKTIINYNFNKIG